MARINLLVLLVSCILFVTAIAYEQKQGKTWCLADVKTPLDQLQAFIDYACNIVNCAPIQAGGACFEPDIVPAHANYALDVLFVERGECNSRYPFAYETTSDPSYGNCKYP